MAFRGKTQALSDGLGQAATTTVGTVPREKGIEQNSKRIESKRLNESVWAPPPAVDLDSAGCGWAWLSLGDGDYLAWWSGVGAISWASSLICLPSFLELLPGNRFSRHQDILTGLEQIGRRPVHLLAGQPLFHQRPVFCDRQRLQFDDPAFMRDPDRLAGKGLIQPTGHVAAGLGWRKRLHDAMILSLKSRVNIRCTGFRNSPLRNRWIADDR